MDVFANKQKITLNQSSFKAAGGEEKGPARAALGAL